MSRNSPTGWNSRFANALRELLTENVGRLFDYRLELMERELQEGWQAFYISELVLRKHLPEPLINELGREYEEEQLKLAIWREPGRLESSYTSTFMDEFHADPSRRTGYRNYLAPGVIEFGSYSRSDPYDLTANEIMKRRIESGEAHFFFETTALRKKWYIDATNRAVLSPPLYVVETESKVPTRAEGVAIADDAAYWKAKHENRWHLVTNTAERSAFTKPDWNLRLMAQMAPDFPYAPGLSTTKRLVFVQQGEGTLAWALMIDKTDGSPDYRYPPQLILIDRAHDKKLKDEHIIFSNVMWTRFVSYGSGVRCLETELLFHIPRSRRLIEFYAPFVEEAQRGV